MKLSELPPLQCGMPGCKHEDHSRMYLHGACHVEAPTWCYVEDNQITIECSICHSKVVTLDLVP